MYNLNNSCQCCPYGYHIDVDFLKFLDIDSDRLFKKNIILHNSHSEIDKKIKNPIIHTQSNFIRENGKSNLCSIYKTTVQKYLNDGQIIDKPRQYLQNNEEFYDYFEGKSRGHSEPNLDRNNPTIGCDVLLVLPNNSIKTDNKKSETTSKTFKSKAEVFIVDNSDENNYKKLAINNVLSFSDELPNNNINYRKSNECNSKKLLNTNNIYNQEHLIYVDNKNYLNNSDKVYNNNRKYEMKDIGLQCKPNVKDAFVSTNFACTQIQKPECADVSVQFDSVEANKFVQKSINDLELEQYDNIKSIKIKNKDKFNNDEKNELISNSLSNYYSTLNTKINNFNKSQVPSKIDNCNSNGFTENSSSNSIQNNTNQTECFNNYTSNLISIIETDQTMSYNNQISNFTMPNQLNEINKKNINNNKFNEQSNSAEIYKKSHGNTIINNFKIDNKQQSSNNFEIIDSNHYENALLDNNFKGQYKQELVLDLITRKNGIEVKSNQIALESKGLNIIDNKVAKIDKVTNDKSTDINDVCESYVSKNPPPRIVDLLESSDSDFAEDEMQNDYCVYHVEEGIVQEKLSGQDKKSHSNEDKYVPLNFQADKPINKTSESNILHKNVEDKSFQQIIDKTEKSPTYDDNLLADIKVVNTNFDNNGSENIQFNINSNMIIESKDINNSIESIDDNLKYINSISSESLMSTSSSSLENLLANSVDNNTFSSPETTDKPQEDILDLKKKKVPTATLR